MKRILIIMSMLCILPVCADAQWYLFPGNRNKQQNKKESKKDSVIVKEVIPDTVATQGAEAQDGDSLAINIEDIFVYDKAETINISLILPLQASSQNPSANFLEMYSGALLALKDLGDMGLKMKLNVIDSSKDNFTLSKSDIEGSHVIIGPVGYNDIIAGLSSCDRHQMLISPLEPRAASLTESSNVVQAPSSWASQIDELVEWIQEEMQIGDELIVLKENNIEKEGEQSSRLMAKLNEKHIRYRTAASLEEIALEDALKYRVLIASDNDAFITRSVRSVGIAAELKKQITLYTSSRVRNCVDANVLDLYNANTRMTAAYHIDYNDEAVRKFILQYRALFKNEPGSFAFQGYDTMKYFVTMCDEYGKNWYKKLPEKNQRGLQSDFIFDKKESKGKMNTAVRRVIYNRDLSTTLLPLEEEPRHWPMLLY